MGTHRYSLTQTGSQFVLAKDPLASTPYYFAGSRPFREEAFEAASEALSNHA